MARKWTREMVDKYVRGGGVSCPFCAARDLEAGPCAANDDGTVTFAVRCLSCLAAWDDVHGLIGVVPYGDNDEAAGDPIIAESASGPGVDPALVARIADATIKALGRG